MIQNDNLCFLLLSKPLNLSTLGPFLVILLLSILHISIKSKGSILSIKPP